MPQRRGGQEVWVRGAVGGCCAVLCLFVYEFAGSRDEDPSLDAIACVSGEARWRDGATRCG